MKNEDLDDRVYGLTEEQKELIGSSDKLVDLTIIEVKYHKGSNHNQGT